MWYPLFPAEGGADHNCPLYLTCLPTKVPTALTNTLRGAEIDTVQSGPLRILRAIGPIGNKAGVASSPACETTVTFAPLLKIENRIRRISLREECLLCFQFNDFPPQSSAYQKAVASKAGFDSSNIGEGSF